MCGQPDGVFKVSFGYVNTDTKDKAIKHMYFYPNGDKAKT